MGIIDHRESRPTVFTLIQAKIFHPSTTSICTHSSAFFHETNSTTSIYSIHYNPIHGCRNEQTTIIEAVQLRTMLKVAKVPKKTVVAMSNDAICGYYIFVPESTGQVTG